MATPLLSTQVTSHFTQPMDLSSEPVSSVLYRVMKEVFDFNQYQELSRASVVCRSWKRIIETTPLLELKSKGIIFGKEDWERYFGEVGAEPPLPPDINEILNNPCPFWPDRRVEDTHLLVLIPETVNRRPLTLDSLGELIQRPHGRGNAIKYRSYNDRVRNKLGSQGAPTSHWALMTKDVIPDSRRKKYADQSALVERKARETNLSYALPSAIDAAVCILMHHAKTGEKLYFDNPLTYTRCQEKVNDRWPVAIGALAGEGLHVYCYFGCASGDFGVGCLRKF